MERLLWSYKYNILSSSVYNFNGKCFIASVYVYAASIYLPSFIYTAPKSFNVFASSLLYYFYNLSYSYSS